MKATRLPLVLFVLLVAGCSNIVIEGQFFQPADVTATALATSIRVAPTSATDLSATAAIERAVRLTLTAAAPSATSTPLPSPNAFLIAFPEIEAVEGWEWPEGAVVHLAIDDLTTAASPDFEQDGIMGAAPGGDTRAYVRFEFAGEYDLKVGDLVTVTDCATGRTHVVRNLSVMAVDAASVTVAGSADPGTVVDVWPHGFHPTALVQVTAGDDGAWLANFAGLFDLAAGTGGRSRILDEAGNATAVDWTAPQSPTAEPTTAIPPTETPVPTATKKPAPQATFTPVMVEPFTGTWVGPDPADGSITTLTLVQAGNTLRGTFSDTYSPNVQPPGYQGSGSGMVLSDTTAQITFDLSRWDGKAATAVYDLTLSNQNNTMTLSCSACPVTQQFQRQ